MTQIGAETAEAVHRDVKDATMKDFVFTLLLSTPTETHWEMDTFWPTIFEFAWSQGRQEKRASPNCLAVSNN